jgi:ribosomal peptide maturation radical SAM protein 1
MNVLLANMPFGSMTRPSFALGLLKSELAAIGVPARVENFALRFAERLGDEAYRFLSDGAAPERLGGDWAFAGALADRDPARDAAYLGHFASRNDEVEMLRLARSRAEPFLDECIVAVDWGAYDVVGFTSTFCQNVPSLALARRIKARHPQVLIVFGGANCEGEMGLGLHEAFDVIDLVCAGEADLTFPAVIRTLRDGGPIEAIPGVIWRDGRRSAWTSLSPARPRDLGALPYPDYDEFFEQLGPGGRRVAVMETSRGCWWGDRHHCTFCGIDFPETFRAKSAERALAELTSLRDRYGVRSFVMTDDILDMRAFRDLLPRLAALTEPVSLFYETKANLTRQQVELLARAGIRQIQPGIESFDSGLLRLMDKGVAGEQNVRLLKWCEELGIEARWNLLYGFPGEDPAAFPAQADTVGYLDHLRPPQGCGPVRLDRFSPYFTSPSSFGIERIRPAEAYGLVYDLPDEALCRFAYYFDFDFADGRRPDEYTAGLRKRVDRWRARYRKGLLTCSDEGDELVVRDCRDVAPIERTFEGWRRAVYRFCDEGRPRSSVLQLGEEEGADPEEVAGFLDELVEARLMLPLDGRYVSLAVRSPRGR